MGAATGATVMSELKRRQSKAGVRKSQTVDGYCLSIELVVAKCSKRPRRYCAYVVDPRARGESRYVGWSLLSMFR